MSLPAVLFFLHDSPWIIVNAKLLFTFLNMKNQSYKQASNVYGVYFAPKAPTYIYYPNYYCYKANLFLIKCQ